MKAMNLSKIIPAILKSLTLKDDLNKEIFECYLELFTVVYLKSLEVFKSAVLLDLVSLVDLLLDNQAKVFCDRSFSLNICMYRISQLFHCLKDKENRACNIKNTVKLVSNMEIFECNVHTNFDISPARIDLTTPRRFSQVICFLLTFFFKILNISKAAGCNNDEYKLGATYTGKMCNVLFNFIKFCEIDNIVYPIRVLAEIFNCDQTELTLSKRLNTRTL
jgi:hypothetical protein